ncbi:threo-3-hydroxy-L-aspartate ammonia-lyase [Pectobacterium sp. A535-S3-A17]|uniref:threo-3-hydroxy-L-aspartate ammonia-lyase n=1 Tax=Pectobacterium quasiaquaticum TaxID=2774015 RepID=UPI0018746F02|nr:threo-3-hydroxy-L-aspartate ammonia-lyase [Pectobacterium quasiaquaticum]MBE5214228.1 threo-3-hydroxy-L-aspartate ammonia-lyase [Pectobacterium quasiaquaticum]MBE5226428.1 threo-3-hydroxy-L-aspartate ammonia-lyase [Pectobacterium quasiaquaticum]
MSDLRLPTYNDVVAAAERIDGYANKTPVMTSRTVNDTFGAEVFFKCENFQRTGAFKFRGAMNALLQFTDAQKAAGVVTFSSGNHAQAIALAAKLLGIPATIVMPHDAPAIKIAATRGYGGNVVQYNRYTEDREQIGNDLAKKHGLTLIPPFDHPHVIAGQGTVVKELLEETGELDALFVCVGGGGLLAGSALSARQLSPQCLIYGVEPLAGNDGQQSLRSGHIVHIDTPQTIADGAQIQQLGRYPFALIRQNVDDILTVTDDDLIDTMQFYAERMKIVVEPTGCLSFAAARNLRESLRGKRIGIVISGGNVDISRYGAFLTGNA